MILVLVVVGIAGVLMLGILGYVANWWGDGVRGSYEECGENVLYDEIVRLNGPGIENESMYCSRGCARRTNIVGSETPNTFA